MRAIRAPSVVRSALRCAVRAFPSPACASVEWAWPAARSGFAPRACSRRSCRSRLSSEIAACVVDPVVTRDRSQSRLGRALAPRGGEAAATSGPFRPTSATHKILFSTTSPVSRSTPNRISTRFGDLRFTPAIRLGAAFAALLTSDRSFAASGRDEPRARVSREPRVDRRCAA